MKKLSDYKGDESIELWAEMLEPFMEILADENVSKELSSGKPVMSVVAEILKKHKTEAKKILLAIDDTPVNAVNFPIRLLSLFTDLMNDEAAKDFFKSAAQEIKVEESFGSPTANTEDVEK